MKKNNVQYLLAGSYTSESFSDGLHVYAFDDKKGSLQFIAKQRLENASFLAFSEDRSTVYVLSENSTSPSYVSAFSFDGASGQLQLINKQVTDDGPCYVSTHFGHLVVGNYVAGSINVFPLTSTGGIQSNAQTIQFKGKGIVPDRQDHAHVHCVYFSPDNKYLFSSDLGTDVIHQFQVNTAEGSTHFLQPLRDIKLPAGEGPRHLVFHPNGKYMYVITELGGNVIAYTYQNESLTLLQTIIADPLHASGSADLHISPDGKFLYASNRLKGDGISIFSIQEDGKLVTVGYQTTGIHPRNFVISKDGRYLLLAARDSNEIQVFARDASSGLLEDTLQTVDLEQPVCLVFQ